jgi:hypothetical protein
MRRQRGKPPTPASKRPRPTTLTLVDHIALQLTKVRPRRALVA